MCENESREGPDPVVSRTKEKPISQLKNIAEKQIIQNFQLRNSVFLESVQYWCMPKEGKKF
jgi:hypothetical protein